MQRLKFKYGLCWGVRPGRIKQAIKDALVLILIGFIILSVYGWVQERDENDRLQQKHGSYTKDLEQVLAHCLSRNENTIVIGGEWFICGITPLGVRS